MRKFLKIIVALLFFSFILSCESDNVQLVNLKNMPVPRNLSASFQIAQDNSGLVTIIPTGEAATSYQIDFGDDSPLSEEIKVGQEIEHTYAEGEYDVEIIGKNLAGEQGNGSEKLMISFLAPENLEVEISPDSNDNFMISVSATADYAGMFHVYFGDGKDEEPTSMNLGESVQHTYTRVGSYVVKVVALSGGEASTEFSQEITITDPLFLPIDFESETLNYTFYNFGGGDGEEVPIVDNPDPSEINNSPKVAAYTKVSGTETWAGTNIPLDEPIDFSDKKYIKMDVWSPIAGAQVIFKIENLDDADINAEAAATTTVANQWETLIFDLSSIDPNQEYGRVVLFFNMDIPGIGETYYFDNIQTTKLEQVKLPLNFESEELDFPWSGFGGSEASVIQNPNSSGINTSNKITQLNKNKGAETWAGASLNLDESLNLFQGTFVNMKVWSPKAGIPILLKLENSQSPSNAENNPSVFVEVIQNTNVAEEWETLSFDLTTFSDFNPDENYDRLTVFYDFDNPGEGSSFYFDDVVISNSAPGPGNGEEPESPTSAAPSPTLAGDNVVSLFSETYSNVSVDTWHADWSVAEMEDINIEENAVKKYTSLDFVGIETASAPVDAETMTYFHTNIWTPNMTEIKIKLVDFGPDGAYGGGDDVEHEIVIKNPEQRQWVSLHIPLSDFTALTTKNHIAQLIYSGTPAGDGILFVDNVYFHN